MRLASNIEVPPEGNLESKLWVLGESPGETEVRERRPFVGMAGNVLNAILAEAGINRSDCYIDNVVRFRPHGNNFKEFYETDLLNTSIRELRERISNSRPNIIIALGSEALRAVGERHFDGGVSTWRGSIIETSEHVKVLPTYHPSYLLRSWSDRPLAVHDFRRAAVEAQFPEVRRRPREIAINKTFEETKAILNDILQSSTAVAFDIETDAAKHITSIAIADSPEFAVVVPVSFRGRSYWTDAEFNELQSLIKNVLESPRIQKIAQNAQYDMIWLSDKWGINVAPLHMDTMVAHSLLMPEFDKSLAFQCSIYTDISYYKHERKTLDADTYFRYNGTDALATFECAQEIETQLREDGLWDFYQKLPHRLLAPLRELSLRGIKIDRDLRESMLEEGRREQQNLIESIREEPTCHEFESKVLRRGVEDKLRKKWEESAAKSLKTGKKSKASLCGRYASAEDYIHERLATATLPSFNPDSPAQLVQYLYDFRGWKPITNVRPDGRRTYTSDQSAIRKLLSQHPDDRALLQSFLDLADITKELEFLRAKLEPDGRLHCTYDITGTETGRISSKKYVYDTGANLQNQPAGKRKTSLLRRVFIPDDGKVFIQRDLKQAEAWVVAFLCQDPFFMDAIRSSDIHRATASLIFKKPENEVTKHERSVAKSCVHALNYGMGYQKFAELTGMTGVQARDIRNRYFAAYPRITMWHSEVKLELQKSRTLVTPFGRKRQFTAGWNEDLWKEAWAYVPQSTVGDLLNTGFIEFWEWLKSAHERVEGNNIIRTVRGFNDSTPVSNEQYFDTQIMLQIHDSLVVQCPEQHVPVIAAKLKQCLERPLKINGREITIPTDLSVGPNWLDLKEIKDG